MRKRLGGGMRQTGILAAAALYALDHHVARLAEDHLRARELAMGLMIEGFDVESPETNILQVNVAAAPKFTALLGEHGVRCFPVGPDRLRLVVHLGITEADLTPTIQAFRAAKAAAAE
jgi:threonine aldolase